VASLLSWYRLNWLLKGTFSQSLYNFNYFFNGLDHDDLCVVAEDDESCCQYYARENGCTELVYSCLLHLRSIVDSGVGN